MYDIIIIGGGPAGLTSSIYAGRSGYNVLVIEKDFCGGQVGKSAEIENYPGFKLTDGATLAMAMDAHAKECGANFVNEEVTNIDLQNKVVTTNKNTYEAKSIILSMGARPRKANVTGENEFYGRGVSYCATCDGAFYRGKDVAVIGGGNTAVEEAIFLSKFCNKVYLVHRRDEFRAEKKLVDTMKSNDKIQCILNSVVEEIKGDDTVTNIVTKNKEGSLTTTKVSGVFVAIGTSPNTELLKDKIELNENLNIITNEHMETSVNGVFAIGDIRNTPLRQIATAVGDGAIGAFSASKYLSI